MLVTLGAVRLGRVVRERDVIVRVNESRRNRRARARNNRGVGVPRGRGAVAPRARDAATLVVNNFAVFVDVRRPKHIASKNDRRARACGHCGARASGQGLRKRAGTRDNARAGDRPACAGVRARIAGSPAVDVGRPCIEVGLDGDCGGRISAARGEGEQRNAREGEHCDEGRPGHTSRLDRLLARIRR